MPFESHDANNFPAVEKDGVRFHLPPDDIRTPPLYSQVEDLQALQGFLPPEEELEHDGIAFLLHLEKVRHARRVFGIATKSDADERG